MLVPRDDQLQNGRPSTSAMSTLDEKQELARADSSYPPQGLFGTTLNGEIEMGESKPTLTFSERVSREVALRQLSERPTLVVGKVRQPYSKNKLLQTH